MDDNLSIGLSRFCKLLVICLAFACAASANQPPRAVASVGVDLNTGQVLNQVTLFIGPTDSGIPKTVGGGSTDPDGTILCCLRSHHRPGRDKVEIGNSGSGKRP